MANQDKTAALAVVRKLQLWAPIGMVVLGALVYWFWKDDLSAMVGGVIAFTAIPDYFAFKIIGDQMEAGLG